jgi:hypothetical protein
MRKSIKIKTGLIILLFVMGCAKIQTDGNTITYSRFGSQNLSDVEFVKDASGLIKMKIGRQESNDLARALEVANEAIKRVPVAIP